MLVVVWAVEQDEGGEGAVAVGFGELGAQGDGVAGEFGDREGDSDACPVADGQVAGQGGQAQGRGSQNGAPLRRIKGDRPGESEAAG